LLGSGCESQEAKCDQARAAAVAAWDGYVGELDKARAAATTAQKESRRRVTTEIEPRLAPATFKLADARYPRSSDAWVRAREFALHDACNKDGECSAEKRKQDEAELALSDLDERLGPARAAAAAIRGPLAQAAEASKAALVHPEFPSLKAAQEATRAAQTECAGLR
jgi:hypothetical protein